MAKYCKYCGKQLRDNASFCSGCGKPFGAPVFQEPSAPVPEQKKEEPRKKPEKKKTERKKPEKQKPAKKKKPVFSGINVFLTLTLILSTAFAGFKCPGWFVNGSFPGLPEGIRKPLANTLEKETPRVYVDEVKTVYTKAELDSAPQNRAVVTAEQPEATAGKYTVDFGEWNLDHEEDTVVVRDLPVKVDSGTGFTMNSFDITLDSGQDKFPTEVTIEMPTDVSPGDVSYCLYYDEEEKRWKYLSSDLSEDGKTRTIYTTHFTVVTEVKLLAGQIGRKGDLSGDELYNIMYVHPYNLNASEIDINLPVHMNYGALWDYMYTKYKEYDIDKVYKAASVRPDNPALEMPYSNIVTIADTGNNVAALTDSGGTIYKYIQPDSWFHKFMDGSGGRSAGNVMALISVYGAYLNTAKEVVEGKTWWDAAMNHKVDIIGASLSSASALYSALASTKWAAGTVMVGASPYVAAAAAVIGLGIFAYTMIYENTAEYRDRELKPTEQIYRDFYTRNNVSRIFFYDLPKGDDYLENNIGVMKYLPSLTDEENKYLRDFINNYDNTTGETGGIPGFSPMQIGGRKAAINVKWARIISLLYNFCLNNKPERLRNVIQEWYESYARAPFSMGTGTYHQFALDDIKFRNYDITSTEIVPDDATRNQIIDNMVREMYENDQLIHADMMNMYKHNLEQQIYDAVQNTLLPVLNTPVEISVSGIGKTVYSEDYRVLEENRSLAEAQQYDKVRSPLRFATGTEENYVYVKGPQFVPWEYYGYPSVGYNRVPAEYYYPKTDNFLPAWNRENDVVFRCTLYHWLMMGAPNVMVFEDIHQKNGNPVAVSFELSEEVSKGKIKAEVKIPDGLTIEDYIGLWRDTGGEGYFAISTDTDGTAGYYEGTKPPGAAGWGVCEEYEIDQKTKTLTLYSKGFIGPAKFTLLDPDTIRMPDQHGHKMMTLKRVKGDLLQQLYNLLE